LRSSHNGPPAAETGLARAQAKHDYRKRLLEPAFWRKRLAGGVGWQALRSFGRSLSAMRGRPTPANAASFQERMAQAWRAFPGTTLLLLSERDLTAQEFVEHAKSNRAWRGWHLKRGLAQQTLVHADHTCSSPPSQQALELATLDWLRAAAPQAS
jgi:hypothetical protein